MFGVKLRDGGAVHGQDLHLLKFVGHILYTDIAGSNIPIFNRKYIFEGSIFQPGMSFTRSVALIVCFNHI